MRGDRDKKRAQKFAMSSLIRMDELRQLQKGDDYGDGPVNAVVIHY